MPRPEDQQPQRTPVIGVAWRTLVLVLLLGIAGVAALVTGCRTPRVVREALAPATPHERYLRGLESAGLADTALAREWRDASIVALTQAAPVTMPFTEELFLDPAVPRAAAYAVTVRRGQRLEVEATVEGDAPARVFLDVFDEATAGAEGRRASASAKEGESDLAFQPDRDGRVILRVQPELLRGGRMRVSSRVQATLMFPVPDVPATALQSIFGDPRDAGSRLHEGIDIFAPRGAPVVAASDGLVRRVGRNNLGGLVVWVWNPGQGHTQYYAHLSEQLVSAGQLVRRGDIIGLVGNTGNAVTTPPHLHFGIYAGGGAVDPAPFVRPVPGSPAAPATASVESLGGWGRIITARTAVREGPSPAAAQVSSAPRNTPVQVNGAVERWVRVQLPDATEGFLPLASLTLAPPPLRSVEVTADTALRTRPDADAPMRGVVPPPARLSVLGTFDEHVLVETDSGQRGWTRL